MNDFLENNQWLQQKYHRLRLWFLKLGKDADYQDYLELQFKRTFSKVRIPQNRTEKLVKLTMNYVTDSQSKSVLCIGSRNTIEIDQFKSYGFQSVTGIDLISIRSDIKIMDMHNMQFPDNTFDVICSSHSLEHAIDVPQVVSEIKRVARQNAIIVIEVPIDFTPRGSDLIDFVSPENLLTYFVPDVQQVLYQDVVTDLDNSTKSARVIFKLQSH